MHAPTALDLGGAEALAGAGPARKVIALILLLAVKDRSDEVRFDPSPRDDAWKLAYCVGGVWHDLVPVPLHVPISREVRRLAGLGPGRRLLARIGHRLGRPGDTPASEQGSFRLLLRGWPVDVGVTLSPAAGTLVRPLESIALCLSPDAPSSRESGQLLRALLQRRRSATEGAGDPA
jgi:hypothetical protein